MNRYLDRRNRRMDMARNGRRDYRNPYGSEGGYVTSRRGRDSRYDRYPVPVEGTRTIMEEDYNDYANDYNDYRRGSRNDYRNDYRDYRDMRDYRNDYNDYSDQDEDYKKDLDAWIKKLKKEDKYGMTEEQTIQQAKSMGVKFKEFDEKEFYAIFLAMVSDYKDISNDPTTYLRMAKDFLEDDDIAVSPSEKVCIYLYQIVKGED